MSRRIAISLRRFGWLAFPAFAAVSGIEPAHSEATAEAPSTAVRSAAEPSLRLLPWNPGQIGVQLAAPAPAPKRSLVDLLSEHDRKVASASLVRTQTNSPSAAPGLLDVAKGSRPAAANIQHRPMLGSMATPLGRMSVVSEKVDPSSGRIAGLDFLRIDIPGWDVGMNFKNGAQLKFSHKWGSTSSERPFQNSDKSDTPLPRN